MLAAGTRLGPYEVLSPIGKGGMGEVYRARDTRLDRLVALKILPEEFSLNPEFRRRFETEAKAISRLSHANICALYDVGSDGSRDFLVMELLEGETLAARLERGALPLEQVLRYGVQIAEALEKAHRAGIVHRDLKPGNVMLTQSGVKLLDFGLAKQVSAARSAEAADDGTTVAFSATLSTSGAIVGTLAYMAPEQIDGRGVDARTDIHALGVTLYELTTGQRPFPGANQASLISSILRDEPKPIALLQSSAPRALERTIRKCLAKDPESRWQSAADVGSELEWIRESLSQTEAPAAASRNTSRKTFWLAPSLVLLAILTAGLMIGRHRPTVRSVPVVDATLTSPRPKGFIWDLAFSPDGSRIALISAEPGGRKAVADNHSIWIRRVDSNEALKISDTEGSLYVFWSPDGGSIGFKNGSELKAVDLSGRAPRKICDLPGEYYQDKASWGSKGVILFPADRGPLYATSATGGSPVPVTRLDQADPKHFEVTHHHPTFLPDGDHFLFLAQYRGGGCDILLGSISSKSTQRLEPDVSPTGVAYVSPGYVLFDRHGTLFARPFDAERHIFTGSAQLVSERRDHPDLSFFAVSSTGVLAYRANPSDPKSQFGWFDRTGNRVEPIGEAGHNSLFSLSPDGKRLAFVHDENSDFEKSDLWVYDLASRTPARLTFRPGRYGQPIWTHDGSQVLYSRRDDVGWTFLAKPWNRSGDEMALHKFSSATLNDASPDGARILYADFANDLVSLALLSLTTERTTSPFVVDGLGASEGQFSPNGRWVAYSSFETAERTRSQVYVVTFPDGSAKHQVSSDGGAAPRWRADGKELFYVRGRTMMVVPLQTESRTLEPGPATRLFDAPEWTTWGQSYGVSPDGQRFVFNVPIVKQIDRDVAVPTTLIVNWMSAIARK